MFGEADDFERRLQLRLCRNRFPQGARCARATRSIVLARNVHGRMPERGPSIAGSIGGPVMAQHGDVGARFNRLTTLSATP